MEAHALSYQPTSISELTEEWKTLLPQNFDPSLFVSDVKSLYLGDKPR